MRQGLNTDSGIPRRNWPDVIRVVSLDFGLCSLVRMSAAQPIRWRSGGRRALT